MVSVSGHPHSSIKNYGPTSSVVCFRQFGQPPVVGPAGSPAWENFNIGHYMQSF